MTPYKIRLDIPSDFPEDAAKTIRRITKCERALGVMYFRNNKIILTSVPCNPTLYRKLPLFNKAAHQALTEITALVNDMNPMVDRIMEDDSVVNVIMTNKEGAPILTNQTLVTATNYGQAMHRLGSIARTSIKEMDPFEEVLVLRVNTKKCEIMVVPHSDFNIIVTQRAREENKRKLSI